jgi:outer membrane immunogenic protein
MSANKNSIAISRHLVMGATILSAVFSMATVASAQEVSRWQGPYVGLQVGSTSASGDFLATTGSCGPCRVVNLDGETVSFGGQAGYKFRSGPYVFGLEASFVSADVSEVSDEVIVGGVASTRPDFTRALDWTAAITPRAGVLIQDTLVYAKAGVAYADTTVGHFTSGGSVYESQSETRSGWVIGAGLEHPFSSHLTGSVEFTHMDFGNERADFSAFSIDHELVIQSVRFGLNYQF